MSAPTILRRLLPKSRVMQGRSAGSQFFLDELDSLWGAKILPETVEAKPVKRFARCHHSRIGLRGRAELSRLAVIVHKGKYSGLENLHAGKHELFNGARRRMGRFGVEKSAESSGWVDIHRTIMIGIFVRAQDQGSASILVFVKSNQLGQIQIDQHIGIDDDESVAVEKRLGFEQPASGIE